MDATHRYLRRSICAWALTALALVALAAPRMAQAQFPDFGNLGAPAGAAGEQVAVSAEFTTASGERPALVFVTARIARGFHMFAVDQPKSPDGGGPQATTISVANNDQVRLVGPFQSVERPKTHIDKEAWVGLELREHEGEVTWFAPVEIAAGVDPASLQIEGEVEGQACDPNRCIPVNLSFTAELGDGRALPPEAFSGGRVSAPAAAAGSVGLPGESERSLLAVAFFGILGGLILNLMPCVLPVIGLKILSFAKQGGESRRHILGLNLAYSAGVLAVFMALATLATLAQLGLGAESYGWGELNTFTWFKVAMTALVFAMALAFLGVWEIPVPGFASSGTATELAAREGPGGAFCMGMFTTLLATPCSGPFLGPVFGYTLTQPPLVTYVVFLAVGIGMALPYFLIGAFPQLVGWLPKPGEWMDTLKQFLAFVLLATVVWLFTTIHPDYFVATLALLFSIWFGCWIVGRVPAWAEPRYKYKGWLRGGIAAAILGGGSFLLMSPSKEVLPWQPYSPAALAAARAEGKTVLVDFTANWCLTCKTNLKLAINRAGVRDLVERNGVVTLLADWTDKNDTIKQALAELNSRSIPLLAIYPANPNAEVIVLPDLLTQGKVLEALEQAGPSREVAERSSSTKTASRERVAAASER